MVAKTPPTIRRTWTSQATNHNQRRQGETLLWDEQDKIPAELIGSNGKMLPSTKVSSDDVDKMIVRFRKDLASGQRLGLRPSQVSGGATPRPNDLAYGQVK